MTAKFSESFSSRIQAEACGFILLFDRENLSQTAIPPLVKPYTSGEHFLSTKQVASATLLAKAGSASAKQQAGLLRQEGFTLTDGMEDNTGQKDLLPHVYHGQSEEYSEESSSLYRSAAESHNELLEQAYSEFSAKTEIPVQTKSVPKNRLVYEDPWLVIAGRLFATESGMTPPVIKNWAGDGIRIQDPLPRRVLGPNWSGSRNAVRFIDIADIEVKYYVVFHHTHWGRRLQEMIYSSVEEPHRWARLLRHRIKRFLAGHPDPSWKKEQMKGFYADNERRNPRSRASRLIEVLKTIDGMYQQRYFSFPEERWSWRKFDDYVLSNLAVLLDDEFLDGSLTELALSMTTRYAQLKAARKLFKDHAHRRALSKLVETAEEVLPRWLYQFIPLWKRVEKLKENTMRYAYLIGNFSQTRGCGTPPPLVVLQSKEKFLKTVSVRDPPLSDTQEALIEAALDRILESIPGEAFTGLSTKARITVTTSACWEKTRREGGTISIIHELVVDGVAGAPAVIRCLDTGNPLESRRLEEFESPGEYIFWRCLDYTLRTPKKDLKYAFLTTVKEPGKARSVTKGRAYLKVVLDLVNKICAEPMKKGIASSSSGMGKSHHGWNFFLSFFDEEEKSNLFRVSHEEVITYSGYEEHYRTYHDLFVSSTDYQTATDSMRHDFSTIAAEAWMLKCGIPPLLRGIVHETCYTPRDIFFLGKGALSGLGRPADNYGPQVRVVRLERGVLMGDPLTKIVLHLANVVTRVIAENLKDSQFLSTRFENPFALSA